MARVDWERPLRHRISGKRVYVVAASSSKNQVALGYGKFGPTEEVVMRNGMQSAHSDFLDLENCSEFDFSMDQKAQSRAAAKQVAVDIASWERTKRAELARQEELELAESNPIWGSM